MQCLLDGEAYARSSSTPPTSAATSPIRTVHGSGAAMRTSTGCYDSTSRNEEALPKSGKATAMPLPTSSTTAPGNAMATRPRSSDSKNYSGCCTWPVNSPLNPVGRMVDPIIDGHIRDGERVDALQAPDVDAIVIRRRALAVPRRTRCAARPIPTIPCAGG